MHRYDWLPTGHAAGQMHLAARSYLISLACGSMQGGVNTSALPLLACQGTHLSRRLDAVRGLTDQAEYLPVMVQEDVDIRALPHLSDEDLIYLGVSDAAQRRRLLQAARSLRRGAAQSLAMPQGASGTRLPAGAPRQGTGAPLGAAQHAKSRACLPLQAPAPCSTATLRGAEQADGRAAEHSGGGKSNAAPVNSIHSDTREQSSAAHQQGQSRGVPHQGRGLKRSAPDKAATSMPNGNGHVSVKQPGSRLLCHSHKPDSKPDPGWAGQPCPSHLGQTVGRCLGAEPGGKLAACPQEALASRQSGSAEAMGQPDTSAEPGISMSGALGHLLVSR